VLDRQLRFTTPTLLNLIRRRDGEPHNTLASTPTWYDEGARRQLDEQVNAVLGQHGLMGMRGIDRGLLETIEAISRPQLEYYGWFEGEFEDAPSNFTVLAGSTGGEAFVLVRRIEEEVVIIAPERSDELLAGFINQIPKCRPGNGQQLSVGKGEFTRGKPAVAESDGGFRMLSAPRYSAAPSPAAEIRRIMNTPRTGGGSLYVAARTRSGARRRIERPLNFIDTAEGRWLMEEVPGHGEPMVVLTPATPQLLADRLRSARGKLSAA
jgi:hypothetical protein